jgi:hypothetical protein
MLAVKTRLPSDIDSFGIAQSPAATNGSLLPYRAEEFVPGLRRSSKKWEEAVVTLLGEQLGVRLREQFWGGA